MAPTRAFLLAVPVAAALVGCANDTQVVYLEDLERAQVVIQDGHRHGSFDEDRTLEMVMAGTMADVPFDTCLRLPRSLEVRIDDVQLDVTRGRWRLSSDLNGNHREWSCERWSMDWPSGTRARFDDPGVSEIVFDDGRQVLTFELPDLRRTHLVDLTHVDGGPAVPGERAILAFRDGWDIPPDHVERASALLWSPGYHLPLAAGSLEPNLIPVDGGVEFDLPADMQPGRYELDLYFPVFSFADAPDNWEVVAWRLPVDREVQIGM